MDKILTPAERYNFAVGTLLGHEGGYSNNPADPGGATNFGITQRELTRCYARLKLPADVKLLTKPQAKIYYKFEWWDKYHYEAINSLYIATKIFDMAVNMGAQQAHILAQRACNWCGHDLKVDGILGGKTLGALNEITLHNREEDLKGELINEQKWFYEHLVEEKPTLKVFLKGWLKRAEW